MRTLDQYVVGTIERFGRYEMTRDEVIEFATLYDPQPFHIDDESAAANPIFGRLTASGWHTASATMRMIVDEGKRHGGHSLGGAGLEELKWLRPVHPGDVLHAQSEILEAKPSKGRVDLGLVKLRTTTFNQKEEAVMTFTATILVATRSD